MNNNNNNRGSELKNKIAGKVAGAAVGSVGGPLAGKVTEKAIAKKGNQDVLSKAASKKGDEQPDSQEKQTAENALNSVDDGGKKKKSPLSALGSKLGSLAKPQGGLTDSNDEEETEGYADYSKKVFAFFRKHKFKIAGSSFLVLLAIIFVVLIPIFVLSLGGTVIEFFDNLGDYILGLHDAYEEKQMVKYYEKLKDVKDRQYKRTKHTVCIDENLITATLTVDLDVRNYKYQHNSEEEEIGTDKVGTDDNLYGDLGENPQFGNDESASLFSDPTDADESSESEFDSEDDLVLSEGEGLIDLDPVDISELNETDKKNYRKMRKQIQTLSYMQIKTIRYGYDKKLGGILGRECNPIDYDEELTDIVVSNEELEYERFDPKGLNFWAYMNVNDGFISNDANQVSKHDKKAFAAFFSKKAKEETNYEFHIYSPKYRCKNEDDDPNTCDKVCDKKLPANRYELSIGDLATRKDSVYYWNLVNSFIPNYYDEYLPSDGEEREEAIMRIADDIYLAYEDLGPGTACIPPQDILCRDDEGADYYTGDGSQPGTSTSEFFTKIAPIAIEEMSRTGINASVTMAQAALESSWGKSGLSLKYSNYYGMTSGCINNATYPPSSYKGIVLHKDEQFNNCSGNAYWDGTVVAMCNKGGGDCQWYRVYDSFANSTRDHSRLLVQSSHYSGCNSYKNSKDQIQCIKNGGYATDPNYVSKVMNMINDYNLTQYDIGQWDGEYVDPPDVQYGERICPDSGSGSPVLGDWANWKQFNEPWASMTVHGTSTQFKGFGCYITSLAILIARSGASVSLPNFDPGVLFKYLDGQGVIGKGGYCNSIAPVSSIVPFNIIAYGVSYSPAAIQGYLNQGYYVQVKLQRGDATHFVAVDHVQGNTVYINDPGSSKRTTIADYNGIKTPTSINVYKIG